MCAIWLCVIVLIPRNLHSNISKISKTNLRKSMAAILKLLQGHMHLLNLVWFSAHFLSFFVPIPLIFLLVDSLCVSVYLFRCIHTEDQETLFGFQNAEEPCQAEWWALWGAPDHDSQCSRSSRCWWKTRPWVCHCHLICLMFPSLYIIIFSAMLDLFRYHSVDWL